VTRNLSTIANDQIITVDLDGVEFKSLPSGLHNLKEDLVYFVHGPYAGTSAFLNVAAGVEERGALMVSAGVLVPLSYGRLGRSWRHADGLKKLAQCVPSHICICFLR
jgi:hypothetical protein